MNDVKLSGRLVRDPELKHTPNGVPVATFSLAVDRKFNREEADFIPIVAWRKTAEFVAKYFRKGPDFTLKILAPVALTRRLAGSGPLRLTVRPACFFSQSLCQGTRT